MTPEKTVIEINGVKLEVDLRTAKRIDSIRVGSRVKVLSKQYSGYVVKHGVVIGFEPFEKLPTIIVATMEGTYDGAKLEFLYYNSETKDVELVIANNDDQASIDKNDIEAQIDSKVQRLKNEILELEHRKAYFQQKFACYWEPVEQQQTA